MVNRAEWKTQKAAAILLIVLLPASLSFGQTPQVPPAPQQPEPLLSPEQLDNLVAPIALYSDPLLGQVLAASTYPLEIAEAQQWLQQNRNLRGAQLVDAARQQNWDPSVQALVAFPDAMNLLANDIRWTTDLGNAFLAQQADVMSAVQRMRERARANGKLQSTPQQVVTDENQNGQSAIEIQPADPQVIYVPVYQPEYVWGPPVWGAYPDLWYPPGFGFGFGFGFAPGIFIGGFFPGWAGWGGWGWGCGWFGHGLFVNAGFFNHYGFRGGFGGGFRERGFGGGGFGGRTAWAHDPGHRMGVPYSNQAVASRFGSRNFNGNARSNSFARNGGQFNGSRFNAGQAGVAQSNRGFARSEANGGGWRHFNGDNRAAAAGSAGSYRQASPSYGGRSPAQSYRAPNYGAGYPAQSYRAGPGQSYRGYSAAPGYRSASSYSRSYAPSYSAPRSYSMARPSFSAPRASGGGFSGGHAGFSGGGHAGFSGGGAHAGGGGHRR